MYYLTSTENVKLTALAGLVLTLRAAYTTAKHRTANSAADSSFLQIQIGATTVLTAGILLVLLLVIQ